MYKVKQFHYTFHFKKKPFFFKYAYKEVQKSETSLKINKLEIKFKEFEIFKIMQYF